MMRITYKIIICGESQIGKTSLILRFTEGRFTEVKSTIGVGFSVKDVYLGQNTKIRLQIWDFAGEKRFRSLLPKFCIGASGCLLLFDVTRPETFHAVEDWFDIIKTNTFIDLKNEINVPIPVLLVGSKIDLKPRATTLVDEREILQFVKKSGVNGYHEISSKTGVNVENVFHTLTKAMNDVYRNNDQ
ncbi:MAG: Rab family GTPase [Promethearchaeota archaeon]